ncbi:hypothetical protein PORCRE_1298 [Porphyromonas crevioricanis JCM 15906]|uniref:Uncharacterized protein n=1 Tax=Porphyromonas crevioricanis JCM 15906 TaxID=1305617 RepID=T1CR89_9PORP|nr:hypothetical protein PORCRE_1298 [Porphyromonas crevioricanis JCM 15906]
MLSPLNRTILELKRVTVAVSLVDQRTLNRTILELKLAHYLINKI